MPPLHVPLANQATETGQNSRLTLPPQREELERTCPYIFQKAIGKNMDIFHKYIVISLVNISLAHRLFQSI
jgi:hypothetical protein